MSPGPRIETQKLSKRYGALCAVDELSVVFEPGRIHALVGENGAGKSTALKMIAGLVEPSGGEIRVNGERPGRWSAAAAQRSAIGMVHQHFMLVDRFSALENLILGAEPTHSAGRLNLQLARERGQALAEKLGFAIDFDKTVHDLSVGERQRLEILRVLFRGAQALLLDEPTAVLSPAEADELYRTLRRLADDGATVVVVSHRLDEIVRHCDVATVLRRGKQTLDRTLTSIAEGEVASATSALAEAIMGGDLPDAPARQGPVTQPEPLLHIHNLRTWRADGAPELNGLNLQLGAGEIVGVAGVEGNGQAALARVLSGQRPPEEGSVRLGESTLVAPHMPGGGIGVQRLRAQGMVVLHEDRHRDEMLAAASVADNLVLGDLATSEDENKMARRRFEQFDVYPNDIQARARELSGGNQQKLVLARALDRKPRALVLCQPTRGVDIGTARTIHAAIGAAASSGVAALIFSADLRELRQLCHRLVVIRRGEIVAELPTEASDEQVAQAMLGRVQATAEPTEEST